MCNTLFTGLLCKPVMFIAGYEMQGLFYSTQGAYRYFSFFSDLHIQYSYDVAQELKHWMSFLLIG